MKLCSRLLRPATGHLSSRLAFAPRRLSTLQGQPEIYVFPEAPSLGHSYLLSLLPTEPPTAALAIGQTSQLPPTPDSFVENKQFLTIVNDVLRAHAADDPGVSAQAAMMASTAGAGLGSQRPRQPGARGRSDPGARKAVPVAVDFHIHVHDQRHPPDFGRVAEPQDIFGSLEVDGQGRFVEDRGRYQASGMYRILTTEGILGLSPFLREKLVQRLAALESAGRRPGSD
ncbi:MAG: hypothetical protein M1826_003295 [Phylliscum demangeonii]|nr:MAG: hypothetical protein M1826_003295 [Phylliscum demangeonii]